MDYYKNLAGQTFELFRAFVDAGFTEEQALELTKTQYANACVSFRLDVRGRMEKDEALRRYRSRFSSGGE